MTDDIKIALIQENPTVGDVSGNLAIVIDHMSRNNDVDLIVFSECFLTGYPLGDLVTRPGFLASVDNAIYDLRKAVIQANGPAVLIGAPMSGSGLPYNAAFLIEPSGAMRTVLKTELPNTDVFNERRTFASSSNNRPTPLLFRGFKLGIMICEDMWHGEVARSLADELADILIVINGSPYQRGKNAVRVANARARVDATGLPLIYVNQVGGQDELVFDGGSFIMKPDSNPIGLGAFEAATQRVILYMDGSPCKARLKLSYGNEHVPYPSNMIETDYSACVMGLRDYVLKTNTPHVFVGVSGGLDSALVLTMAVDALGADRVFGVMMPSAYTSDLSNVLADDLCSNLGVRGYHLPIQPSFEATALHIEIAANYFSSSVNRDPNLSITRENIQARLRGMNLMGLTNALGGIVLSTGNKSEISVGYATLYGDMCGGFNPLKSVWKTLAFDMARWRNQKIHKKFVAKPIPEEIITRPPSAELAEGQTDSASLGSYEVLDHVLKALIEDKMDWRSIAREMAKSEFADRYFFQTNQTSLGTYCERIAKLVRGAQYKRDQACPGVKLNATDFGDGWQYPIAGAYEL
jgi:NAD+ synthase